MRISTTTERFSRSYGDVEAVKKLAEAGFEALDYSMFAHDKKNGIFSRSEDEYLAHAEAIRESAEKSGIAFAQMHAMMPTYTADEEENAALFQLHLRGIKTAGIIGAPYIVIHPAMLPGCRYDLMREESFEKAIEIYKKLEPYAVSANVKIATENMFAHDPEKNVHCSCAFSDAEDLLELLDRLDSDNFVVCLDVGHALITGSTAAREARVLGKALKLLHVHENDSKTDLHYPPFYPCYKNDWQEFMQALKDIGYSGDFSLESDNIFRYYPTELLLSGARHLADIARYMLTL